MKGGEEGVGEDEANSMRIISLSVILGTGDSLCFCCMRSEQVFLFCSKTAIKEFRLFPNSKLMTDPCYFGSLIPLFTITIASREPFWTCWTLSKVVQLVQSGQIRKTQQNRQILD